MNLLEPFKIIKLLFLAFLCLATILLLKNGYLPFIEKVDLVFHEAGHMIFLLFGRTMHFLGGTFAQLFFPVVFMLYFLREKKIYSALIMVWWVGENLVDIGTYMMDARTRKLPLLGGSGSVHDWWYLFNKSNLIQFDKVIGSLVWFAGVIAMIWSLAYAAYVVYHEDE